MLFMAEFGPHAKKPNVLQENLEPHLKYLEQMKGKVLLSATKHAPDSEKAVGFVWLIEADNEAEAEQICQQDPFWVAGLRTSFQLSRLTKALPDYIASI